MSEFSSLRKQTSSGMRVRDMVRRYDTAVKTDSARSSYSSIGSTKSSYFGINANANEPIPDDDEFEALYNEEGQEMPQSPSRSSSGSQKTAIIPQNNRSPQFEEAQSNSLENQKSFMNLSRSRDRVPPQAKRVRRSSIEKMEAAQPPSSTYIDDKMSVPDASYQSKTTISKTPKGVRIIVDIYFDQNRGIAVEDVVGSRIETDIPPSKILKEFQKRVSEASQE